MLSVPTTAIVKPPGGAPPYCVVVVDGTTARRPVVIGLDDGTSAEVVSGLDGGESVVKSNAGSLDDGQPVTVITPQKGKS